MILHYVFEQPNHIYFDHPRYVIHKILLYSYTYDVGIGLWAPPAACYRMYLNSRTFFDRLRVPVRYVRAEKSLFHLAKNAIYVRRIMLIYCFSFRYCLYDDDIIYSNGQHCAKNNNIIKSRVTLLLSTYYIVQICSILTKTRDNGVGNSNNPYVRSDRISKKIKKKKKKSRIKRNVL